MLPSEEIFSGNSNPGHRENESSESCQIPHQITIGLILNFGFDKSRTLASSFSRKHFLAWAYLIIRRNQVVKHI